MTRITAKAEYFRRDYQNDVLPALFRKQDSDCDFSIALPSPDSDFLVMVIGMARMTLLIACDELKDPSLIKALQDKADKGVRIYLLLGSVKRNQAAIDALSGRCLIRNGVAQQGCLLLVDHSSTQAQGLMMSAPRVADGDSWAIQLEPQQIDDSFRSFCKLFWERSNEEYLQQNQQQPSVKHPDGNIVTNHSHQLCGTLNDCLGDTLEHLQAATHSGFNAVGDGWQLLLSADSDAIENHARIGVALTDQPMPSLLLSGEGNWLLPQHVDFQAANWCLKLSDQQSKTLAAAYDLAIQEAAWQYQSEIRVGELSDEQTFRFSDQPGLIRSLESLRDVTLDDVKTQTIDSFLNDTPDSLTATITGWQRDQLAHKIDYRVTIHPPYCPEAAKPDSLYQAWEKSEQDWQKRLEVLTNAQSNIDQQQAGIADKLRGFIKGFLLGQGQSVKALNLEINTLKNWSVTKATPAEREQHRQRLESLQGSVRQRGADTEQKVAEAEQNQRWEQRRDVLEADQLKASELLKQKSSALDQLEKNKTEAISQVEQTFSDSWVAAAKKLTDQQLNDTKINDIQPEQFLAKALPKIQQAAPKGADESEKQARQEAIQKAKSRREELKQQAHQAYIRAKRQAISDMTPDQANNWKTSIKEKLWKKHYSAFERCFADHEQGLKKIERDIQEAQKALDKSKVEQERAEKALDEHGSSFVYQTKQASDAFAKQLGVTANKASGQPYQWPEEELPADGTELRKHKQTRYLVITDTDQLSQARKDAERLNASIVCDKEPAHA